MKNIAINYAYEGFLYAPLFLADDLGLFPKNMKLIPRDGDLPTIESLSLKNEVRENWFAICDPFAKEISEQHSSLGGKDPVYIVGVFINRLPIWLYNNNPSFQPVANEMDLKRHISCIEKIRCYEKYNTGYLIGERLRSRIFQLSSSKLKEVGLGEEFVEPPDYSTLVVTSDILSISKEIDTKNIVFNYPQKSKQLNPFLFTGILTLKSVIDEHLFSVLAILSGLRTAIDILSADEVSPENLKLLSARYSNQLTGLTNEEKTEKIQSALYVLKQENIYSKDFDINDAALAYENAKKSWEELFTSHNIKKTFQPIEKVNDPIPALLIKKNWRSDKNLLKMILKALGYEDNNRTLSQKDNKTVNEKMWVFLEGLTFLGVFFIFLYSLYKTVTNFPQSFSIKGDNGDVLYFLLLFIIILVCVLLMFLCILIKNVKFFDNKKVFWICLPIILTVFGFQLDMNPVKTKNPKDNSIIRQEDNIPNSNETSH